MARITAIAAALVLSGLLFARADDKKVSHDGEINKAVDVAEAWLPLVDQEKYGESWDAMGRQSKDAQTSSPLKMSS